MKTKKALYRNIQTGEAKSIEAEVDADGHIPMYQYINGDEWKAVSKWSLNVVNSGEFFASAHEPRVKFTKPPLEGDDFPYGVT